METIKDPPCNNSLAEVVKADVTIGDMAVESVAPQVCQKSNGVVEAVTPEINTTEESISVSQDMKSVANDSCDVKANNVKSVDVACLQSENVKEDAAASDELPTDNVVEPDHTASTTDGAFDCDNTCDVSVSQDITESQTFTCPEADLGELQESSNIEEVNLSQNVSFETEVLVEENVDLNEPTEEAQNDSHLLNELNESMEFSEVLNSSDVSSNVENNNGSMKQEVFNKEELLDILQGKNEDDIVPQNINKQIETQIALRQLSRLKRENKTKASPKNTRNKRLTKDITPNKRQKDTPKKLSQKQGLEKNKLVEKFDNSVQNDIVEKHCEIEEKDGDSNSIVDVLVKDWEDDDLDAEQPNDDTTKPDVTPTGESKPEETVKSTPNDSMGENQAVDLNKTSDECHTRRLGRVIKKKVIFDPDNPDTFTKGKTPTKSKEQIEPPAKSRKVENATSPRAKSKSPVGKGQWKKPTPKGNKHYKRLTEVDKLLMDEGIVNMMYQLTPEVSKGKKTMRTKAEIIKKLQSSNPEKNEMKFRERKKEEAKKILGGKLRTSMSSSVKSVGEDFEAHSADDSIIYRRHSSSSYSSSCMSPRRMSDVETNAPQSVQATPQTPNTPNLNKSDLQVTDVFVPDTTKSEMINKEDCISLKQKLNSKLSQALNKRKRESTKTDKPIKQIKVKEETAKSKMLDYIGFKYLNVKFDQRLAEININQSTSKNTIPILRELELALSYVDKKSDVSVTYLTSTCGTLINPVLNLQPLLDNNIETRTNSAHELAEAVRILLCAVKQHSKLTVSSVWGECGGLSLALLGLCDVVLASELATFALQPPPRRAPAASAPLHPGVAVFTTGYRRLPQSMVNDLVLFGRRLSASEAAAGGLVSRVIWPERYQEHARALAKDIAGQPAKTVQLKKRLLGLKNNSDSDNTFLSCLDAERDMFVEYWTSVEGQELLRAYLTPV